MASSNSGPNMTGETTQQQNVSMPAIDTLRLENSDSVTEPTDTSDDNDFKTFSFHSSNVIGRGFYSTVFKGTIFGDQEVAVKRIPQTDAEIAKKECINLLKLSHPNVVKNKHFEEDKHFIYIVLELCHTNLYEMVIAKKIDDYAIKVNIL